MESNLNLAKHFFYSKCYEEAISYFELENMYYEMGFCNLLMQNQKEAARIWNSNPSPCLATKWGLIVLELIHLKSKTTPGFFQIRAFLEVYLNLFLENELYDYAENLISAYPILSKQNYESCKFIARVLFAHNYINAALDFVKKSKLICYPDPESLLIEAQCYFNKDFYDLAKDCLDELLQIVPEYMPAIKLKNEVLKRFS